nr:COMM domain-containing protein 4-like [Procambarus clarkii]
MRFRFCWDIDCPDWLLAEIATLSKLSSVKLRLLAAAVAKSCYGPALSHEVIEKIRSDATLERSQAHAVVAAIRWVLESAAGAVVAAGVLDSELQQLGLPKEHAAALTKVYSDHHHELLRRLHDTSLKVGGDISWSCKVVGVSVGGNQKAAVQLSLQGGQPPTGPPTTLTLTPAQLHALIHELTEARQLMESVH